MRRVHTPPRLLTVHTAAHTAKHGRFGWGWYHYPRSVPHVSETLRGRVSERQTLPFLGLGRVRFRRAQRACRTAMCSCASLFRGVAAPPTFAFTSESEYTLGFLRKIVHNGTHAEMGLPDGAAITTPEGSARSQTSPGRVERRTLPLLGLGRVCPERGDSGGAAMLTRVALPEASRLPAAASFVCNLVMLLLFHSVRSTFERAR